MALLALLVVFTVSLTLNCIGLSWGQPGGYPWHSDSIAGVKTLNETPNMIGQWHHKYPRVHFLVNATFYKPFLSSWDLKPIVMTTQEGRPIARYPGLSMEQVSTLIMVSRYIAAFMGAFTVVAVFLTARILWGGIWPPLFAGLALACTNLFVLFSHLGNTDIPCIFWYTWGLYWAVKAAFIGKWRHFALAGLFFSLSICTKDPVAGFLVGMFLTLAIVLIANAASAGVPLKKAFLAVFSKKVLLTAVVFLFTYALLNDLLTSPSAYVKRMNHWLGGAGVSLYQGGFRGHGHLLLLTWNNLYSSLGWPLLATAVVSLVYTLIRFPKKALFALLPLVTFYLIVILNTRLSVPRYFLAAFGGLALVIGKTLSDWLNWRIMPLPLRIIPIVIIFVLSALYCIGLDLEMRHDSRIQAERWIKQNVPPNNHVATIGTVTNSPRLQLMNIPHSFRWGGMKDGKVKPTTEKVLYQSPAFPPYIVMIRNWYSDRRLCDQKFKKAIFDGSLGYEKVATFENKFLHPRSTIFAIAGRPRPLHPHISPKVVILKKR